MKSGKDLVTRMLKLGEALGLQMLEQIGAILSCGNLNCNAFT